MRPNTTERAASAPPSGASQLVKFTQFLLTAGLCFLVRDNAAALEKASALSRMAHGLIDADALARDFKITKNFAAFDPTGTKTVGNTVALKLLVKKTISQMPTVPDEELKALKFALLWTTDPGKFGMVDRMKKQAAMISGKLYRNVEKVLDAVGDGPAGNRTAAGETPSIRGAGTDKLIDDYVALAQQIVPTVTDGNLTTAQTKAYAEANGASGQEVVRAYNRAKRVLGEQYILDLTKYVTTKGGPTPVHLAFKHMADAGYPFSKIIAAKREIPLRVNVVSGKVKYYTADNEPLAGGIPANINKIGFPDTYNPETKQGAYMVFKAPTAVGVTRIYTESHKSAAQVDKFSKADDIAENITTYLARWVRDLNSRDPFEQMAAAICYIIYATGARIGSRQFSAASNSGEQTYGIISLRPRHVRITGTSIIFEYSGKKGGAQKHVIKITDTVTRRLAQLLTQLKEGKRKDDLIFSVPAPNGKLQHIIPARVNSYLREMGYAGGPHKMRHVRGTNLVIELLAKKRWKPSDKAATLQTRQREAEDYMKTSVLEPVGKLLGHFAGDKVTWRTSIANYINPNVVANWFLQNGLKVPAWVPKTIPADD